MVFLEHGLTKCIRILDNSVSTEDLFSIIKSGMQFYESVPGGRNAHEAHIRSLVGVPTAESWFKIVTMRAAVPEKFSDFNFIGTADDWLAGHQANEMGALLKLPVLRFGNIIGPREQDCLFLLFLWLSGRFLNDLPRVIGCLRRCVGGIIHRIFDDLFRGWSLRFDGHVIRILLAAGDED